MNQKRHLTITTVIIGMIVLAAMHSQSRAEPPATATKWEYFVMLDTYTEAGGRYAVLNQKGNEGWELVAVTSLGNQTYCYFKRPKP
jgi:hypothetical protein